jgi:hypothetical protein
MPVHRQYAAISMATMFIVSAASVARSRHALPGVPLVGLGVRQHLLAVRDRLGDQLVKRPPQRPGHLRVLHGRTVEGTEGRLSTTIEAPCGVSRTAPASSAPSANAWTAWTPRSRRPCDAPASGPGCRRGAAGPPQADRSWAPAAGSPRCGGSVVSGGTGVRAAAWRACTVPSALLDGHRSTGTRCSCGPGRRSAPTSPRLPVSLFDVVYLSVEHAEIYIGRSRHWGGVVGMVSLVAEINRARQRRTAGQQYTQLQFAGRCGDGVSKPGLLQDGDGTGDRTG